MPSSGKHEHIPYDVLAGYIDGVLGEHDLKEYESHCTICRECADSAAFARKRRVPAHMLWTDEGLVLLPPFHYQTSELSSQHEQWLKKCFLDFGSQVNMVAGEANTKVYTIGVAEAIENALASTTDELSDDQKAKIVCGPVIVVDGDEGYRERDRVEGTILTRLHKHRDFLVYFSDKRQKEHFRVAGGNVQVYVETPHSVCEGTRESFIYRHDPIVCKRYAAKFQNILTSPDVRLSKDPREDFIFLTETELLKLKQIVDEKKLDYDKQGKRDLGRLIEENQSRVFADSA